MTADDRLDLVITIGIALISPSGFVGFARLIVLA